MDLNTQFLINHSEAYVESRLASASKFGYGNGSPLASMIAMLAAGTRKAAATIERWARGTDVEVIEHRLPRLTAR